MTRLDAFNIILASIKTLLKITLENSRKADYNSFPTNTENYTFGFCLVSHDLSVKAFYMQPYGSRVILLERNISFSSFFENKTVFMTSDLDSR